MIHIKSAKVSPKPNGFVHKPCLDYICSKYIPHHFLIAMPQAAHGLMQRAVLYVYQHNENGASGIIINKDLSTNLGALLDQLAIQPRSNVIDHPILFGGPVNPDNGFILYPQTVAQSRITPLDNGHDPLAVTTSRQDLEDIAAGKGPETFLVSLGYCSWSAGQLEKEIQNFDWLVIRYDEELLFTTPIDERRAHAAKLAGFDINQLRSETGYA